MNRRQICVTILLLSCALVVYLHLSKSGAVEELKIADQKSTSVNFYASERPTARFWRYSKADSEVRQVVFAKVHKAASSTVQNILIRFAVFRDLNILLAANRLHLSDRHSHIKNTLPHPEGEGKPFDILCTHIIFNATEIGKYFRESAVRVAILREPMHQALSALAYYMTRFPSKALRLGFSKHTTDPINGFLRHPGDFQNFSESPAMSYINNRMSVDLGFDLEDFEKSKKNRPKIKAFIKQVEEQFDIVLISDYFHESMILLKRYLQWSMKDILYIKKNVATFKENSVWRRRPVLTSNVSKKFRAWNALDYELYEHFEPIFLDKIKKEQLFQDEVTAYKEILRKVADFCLKKSKNRILHIPSSEWTQEFTITTFECNLMLLPEPQFVAYANQIQRRRYEKAKEEAKRQEQNKTRGPQLRDHNLRENVKKLKVTRIIKRNVTSFIRSKQYLFNYSAQRKLGHKRR